MLTSISVIFIAIILKSSSIFFIYNNSYYLKFLKTYTIIIINVEMLEYKIYLRICYVLIYMIYKLCKILKI